MKISVFYDHILQASEQSGKNVLTVCREVKEAGIDAVEIRLGNLLGNDEVFEYLGDAKLEISCIYDFYDMPGCDEKAHMENHINTAALVGAKNILVVPGFFKESNDNCDEESELNYYSEYSHNYECLKIIFNSGPTVQAMIKNLNYMVEYAADKGVTVTVEDFDGYTSPLSTINGVRYFIEHVPGLKHTLDCGNYVFSDEDVMEAWDVLKDNVVHVHCKDRGAEEVLEFVKSVEKHGSTNVEKGGLTKKKFNKGLAPVATGEGYLPIKEIVTELKEKNYDGYLAIEHFDAPEQRECMKRSAEFLRTVWGK